MREDYRTDDANSSDGPGRGHARRKFLKLTVAGAGLGALAGPAVLSTAGRASAVTAPLTSFTHPGILHNSSDLARIKSRVGAGTAPWYAGYQQLAASGYSSSSYSMAGPYATVSRGSSGYGGNDALWSDANAAYQNALMWVITGDTAHATKALQIIKGWSTTLTLINGSEAELAGGIYGAKLAAAAEIMHYTAPSGSWTSSQIARTVAMFEDVFVPVIEGYDDSGWGLMCLRGMFQIGVFCDNLTVFNAAYNAFYTNNCCSLGRMINSTGQCTESGRDQQHTQLILGALAEVCETAWIQGLDLYGAADKRLLSGFEYKASYSLGNNVDFTPWGGCKVTYNTISSENRGEFRPIYEMGHNHYVKRLGGWAGYTSQAAARLRPEGAAFQCDHPGFGTLLYTR
ncbi:alginate lyase family protein [Streptomyces sp. NPDC058464]|uniref:alginate lyase family protein n=1 Tax=Streptomyces sp. NPDC058464 TaxID=3346511 RepID=UPI00365F6CE3